MLRCAILLLALPVAASPTLHVRARMRIDLQSLVRTDGGMVVRGALVDSSGGTAISGRTARVAVSSLDGGAGFYRYAEPTREGGAFVWNIPLAEGRYEVRIDAGGDDDFAAAETVRREIDLRRRTPVLELEVPDSVRVGTSLPAHVRVHDDDAEPGDTLPVLLLAGAKRVGRAEIGGVAATMEVPAEEFRDIGAQVKLTARFDGDLQRNPVSVERVVTVMAPTWLSLATSAPTLPRRGQLEASGELRDPLGPVAGVPVELFVGPRSGDGTRVGRAITDAAGHFRADIHGEGLSTGEHFIEARFAGTKARDASRSPLVAVEVIAAGGNLLAFLVAPAAVALLLLGFWIRRLRSNRRQAPKRSPPPRPRVEPSVTDRALGLLSRLGAPASFDLGGTIIDARTANPVDGATLSIQAGATTLSITTDAAGRFTVDALPGGVTRVEISAAGYLALAFTRELPHRGELSSVEIRLVALRDRIFEVWSELAIAWTRPRAGAPPSTPLPVTVRTPREILDDIRRRRLLVDDLAALVPLVEVACFGRELPTMTALADVEAQARRAQTPQS